MVLFSLYAYYQFYLLVEGILNFDFDDLEDQTCNVFCTRSISITIVPLILFGFLLYQRRFVSQIQSTSFRKLFVFSVYSRFQETGIVLLFLSHHYNVPLLVIWSNWCIH